MRQGLAKSHRLTVREIEILELTVSGASCRQCAEALSIGESTVRKHRGSIFRKLGVRNAAAAVSLALFNPNHCCTSAIKPLTVRKRQIAELIAQGHSSKQIARILGISDLTVRKHREQLYASLDVHSASDLARYLRHFKQ
jgi:DNA-binding CsgD family transcriptional regulator